MPYKILVALFITLSLNTLAQDNAFRIYTGQGKKSSYKKITKELQNQDVVFFGELHDNPIAHWMEVEIAKTLSSNKQVTFGAEMLESNDQQLLNAFMYDSITLSEFDSLAGLWGNFETDYLPLVEIAKQQKSKFIATNIPRKFASQVFKEGIESLEELSIEEKSWIAPLPIAYDSSLTCYSEMLKMMPAGHGGENFPKAQAIKDATMAHFIKVNLGPSNAHVFFHINGSYHSENKEGIVWYLNNYGEGIRILTIQVVTQENIDKLALENLGLADFIIVVDADMTSSY